MPHKVCNLNRRMSLIRRQNLRYSANMVLYTQPTYNYNLKNDKNLQININQIVNAFLTDTQLMQKVKLKKY